MSPIFVSLAERCARIIADGEIAARAPYGSFMARAADSTFASVQPIEKLSTCLTI
jgi:uncharacterized membrane protein